RRARQQGGRRAPARCKDHRRDGAASAGGRMRQLRGALLTVALVLAGCVGATMDSAAPVDQSAAGTWAKRAPLPTAREEVAVAALGELIYVIGGFGAAAEPVATVEAYDVAADRWQARSPYRMPVHHAAAAAVGGR